MKWFNWRRLNIVLHRDVGYLIVAMVIVYGVSGLAINHVADWNPNYSHIKEVVKIEPVAAKERDSIISETVSKLKLPYHPETFFRPDSFTAQLLYPGKTYSVDLPTGNVLIESNPTRPVLYEMNQLHVNATKGIWTYIADLFAVSLIFMGFTGLFMLRGSTGFSGRGKWLVGIGSAIPFFYWIWNQYLQ